MNKDTPTPHSVLSTEKASENTVALLYEHNVIDKLGQGYAFKYLKIASFSMFSNLCFVLSGLWLLLSAVSLYQWVGASMHWMYQLFLYLLPLICILVAIWAYPSYRFIQHLGAIASGIILGILCYQYLGTISTIYALALVFAILTWFWLLMLCTQRHLWIYWLGAAQFSLLSILVFLTPLTWSNEWIYLTFVLVNLALSQYYRGNAAFLTLFWLSVTGIALLQNPAGIQSNTIIITFTIFSLSFVASMWVSYAKQVVNLWNAHILIMSLLMLGFIMTSVANAAQWQGVMLITTQFGLLCMVALLVLWLCTRTVSRWMYAR